MSKSLIFLIISLFFLGGVFLRSFFEVGIILAGFILILALAIAGAYYKNKKILVFAVALMFFAIGILRVDLLLQAIGEKQAQPIQINGEAEVLSIKQKEKYKQLIVKYKDDLVLVNADVFEDIQIGQKYHIDCHTKVPENFSEDFDYKMYLAKSGIYYVCPYPKKFEVLAGTDNFSFLRIIYKVKDKFEQNVNQVIPQPQAGLANGLLFGGDERLSEELKEKFSKTGMTHIVAVSGYNVTIIAEYFILAGIFLGLWRQQAFYFALFGIVLFITMIGFPPSAIRAGIMGTLLLWAIKNGRLANSYNALICAGVIMILINPLLMRWDIGFQLSFLASLGIISFAPIWQEIKFKKKWLNGLFEIIVLTLSAQFFVLPIILFNFKTLSLVSLLANLLVLPIIPITMLFVFVSSLSGFIWGGISIAFGWLAYFPLKWEVSVINVLSDFKYASLDNIDLSWIGLLVWYIFLVIGLFVLKRFLNKKNEK